MKSLQPICQTSRQNYGQTEAAIAVADGSGCSSGIQEIAKLKQSILGEKA